MDGFDDLLNPSRHALEDNPFADPFLKRPNSPDPWATPFASTDTSGGFGSTSDHFGAESTYQTTSHEVSLSSTEEEHPIPDPLDSAAQSEEDEEDNKPLGNLRSPGFRESVPPPAPFSETATIRPINEEGVHTHAESFSVSLRTPTQVISTPAQGLTSISATSSTAAAQPPAPSRTSSGFASPPQSATESNYKSPLEPFGALEHSIAGISLGGEAAGGWQAEETPWQTETLSPPRPTPQAEEDSDDDKPILQTVSKQHGDVNSVCVLLPMHHYTYLIFLDFRLPHEMTLDCNLFL
jgi:sorting nexin-1/2